MTQFGHRPPRKGRSVDLESSPTKAAAWLWHLRSSSSSSKLHAPSTSTSALSNPLRSCSCLGHLPHPFNINPSANLPFHSSSRCHQCTATHHHYSGRFKPWTTTANIDAGRSSREYSRFWQESRSRAPTVRGGWECDSDLFDALELVSVSKRIDSAIVRFAIESGAVSGADYSIDAHDELRFPTDGNLSINYIYSDPSEAGGVVHDGNDTRRSRSRRQIDDRMIGSCRSIRFGVNNNVPSSASESSHRRRRRRPWKSRFRAMISSSWQRLFAIGSDADRRRS